MIITYQGANSFKVSQGDLSLVVNPLSKLSANVTLFSAIHSASSEASHSEKSGFVIDGPGEYEVNGIFIKGFLSQGERSFNTIYSMMFEGMKLCFLGDINSAEIKADVREAIEGADILFVPAGTKGGFDSAASYKFAVSLEPAVIIPFGSDKSAISGFLKEGGQGGVSAIDKLVVKKKDLEGKEGEIIVLKEE